MSAAQGELRFDGRVAVVTGAGRGIGREHALALAARGATLVVNDIGGSPESKGVADGPAAAVVGEIAAAGGVAVADAHDIGTPAGAAGVIKTAVARFGRIDIVIHNAGITHGPWQQMIDVHLSGGFWLAEAAWPHFREQAYGRFVTTSSGAGLFGTRPATTEPLDFYGYGAAKAGVVGLTRNLALEGAPIGIKVNCVAPVALSRLTASHPDPAVVQWLGKHFDASHIATAIVCLAHETCPANGSVFSVGGGRVAEVIVAEVDGFFSPDLTPELLMANFAAVAARTSLHVPRHLPDEMSLYQQMCGISAPVWRSATKQ